MKDDMAQSVVSYGVGGGGIILGKLLEIADYAQAVAVIAGCVVVLVRLCHDGLKFWRYLKSK